jgi:predicted XRE-type DNA-binding protein
LTAFIGLPVKGQQANHINGDKTFNSVENLEWCSCSENIRHAFKLGLKNQKGENNNASTISDHEIYLIKSMLNNTNYTQIGIANIFHVTQQTVSDIKLGRRRNDVVYSIGNVI